MFPLSGKVHAGSKISSREISSIYVDHEQYDRSNRQLCRTSRYGMIHSKNKTSEGDLLRGCVGRHVPHTNRHGRVYPSRCVVFVVVAIRTIGFFFKFGLPCYLLGTS